MLRIARLLSKTSHLNAVSSPRHDFLIGQVTRGAITTSSPAQLRHTHTSAPAHKRTSKKGSKGKLLTERYECEAVIDSINSQGVGVGKLHGHTHTGSSKDVVHVPTGLPGERLNVRVYKKEQSLFHADLLSVIDPSPDRVTPRCPHFGKCGGCQFQNWSQDAQAAWKHEMVVKEFSFLDPHVPVSPTKRSPLQYGYRSKLTPHFYKPSQKAIEEARGLGAPSLHKAEPTDETEENMGPETGLTRDAQPKIGEERGTDTSPEERVRVKAPIGFRSHSGKSILDITHCLIATQPVNDGLTSVRAHVLSNLGLYKKGATLLVRETEMGEGKKGFETDPKATVTERVGKTVFQFPAGTFFQNNPSALPELISHVSKEAAGDGECDFLVDAYCGAGLFAISTRDSFVKTIGIEISEASVEWARRNAEANKASEKCSFVVGDATHVFTSAKDYPPGRTSVIVDPPRKGCDVDFLTQLLNFKPGRIVYVSCNPETQARDVKTLVSGGYRVSRIVPFDLFPHTKHIECVVTLTDKSE